MLYIPYLVDNFPPSHPPNGDYASHLKTKYFKNVSLWNFSMPHVAPPLTLLEVGLVVASDKCIAKY